MDFKTKARTRDKEGHYIMIMRSIQQEDRTVLNTYAPNMGAPKYIRQIVTDIMGEIDSNMIIVRDADTPLTSTGRSSERKLARNPWLWMTN